MLRAAGTRPIPGTLAPSFAQRLNQIKRRDANALSEIAREAEERAEASIGHRSLAPSTWGRHESHLKWYRDVMRVHYQALEKTDDEIDLDAFPTDFERLYKQLRVFMIQVYMLSRPTGIKRSNDDPNLKIRYATFMQYRQSMIFWINRIYRARNIDPPPIARLFNEMTEAMGYAQYELGTGQHYESKKTYLGLAELRQLIDQEMMTTPCIELSEEHQAAWCLGRVTCCRPGSIGPSKGRPDGLRWKDLEFSRGAEKGQFNVIVTFRNLKTNYAWGEKGEHKAIPCYIKSPTVGNLMFSVPHRLLTIALRRGILEGISNVDELFEGTGHYIKVKERFLNDVCFIAGGFRGLSLDSTIPPKPISSNHFTSYLRLRGENLGFKDNITFYSIRRRAATDSVRRIGLEMTRQLMVHKPESKALEKYYLFSRPTTNLTAVLLEEELGSGGYDPDMVQQWAPLALNRLAGRRIARFHGSALNTLVRVLIEQDPVPPQTTTERDVKNYLRRMRRRAFAIMLEEEIEDQSKQMTQEEMQQRISALEASRFAEVILERTKEAQKQSGRDEQDDRILSKHDVGGVDFDSAFPDEDVQAADLEDAVYSGSEQIDCDVGEDDEDLEDSADGLNDIEYHEAAKQLMLLLLDNQMLRKAMWKDRDQRCPLCLVDETASAEMKEKEYAAELKVIAHMQGWYHAPIQIWRRRMQAQCEQHPEKLFVCPYCPESNPKSFEQLKVLEDHIVNPNQAERSEEHERKKEEDGWNSDDFFGRIPDLYQKDNRKNFIKRVGIEEVPAEKLPELKRARRHETLNGVWYARPFDTEEFLSRHPNISEEASGVDDFAGSPKRLKGIRSGKPFRESEDMAKLYESSGITVDEEGPGMAKINKWRKRNGLMD